MSYNQARTQLPDSWKLASLERMSQQPSPESARSGIKSCVGIWEDCDYLLTGLTLLKLFKKLSNASRRPRVDLDRRPILKTDGAFQQAKVDDQSFLLFSAAFRHKWQGTGKAVTQRAGHITLRTGCLDMIRAPRQLPLS